MFRTMKIAVMVMGCTLVLAAGALAFDNVYPSQAYSLVASDPNVYILDVRTLDEWMYVGHPGKNKLGEGVALDGKVANISYKIWKAGEFVLNPGFLSDVDEIFGRNPNVVLITMCRSGQRSQEAATALEAAGYNVLNMVTGFEGGKDAAGYRTRNGWKVDGLPYTYSGAGYTD